MNDADLKAKVDELVKWSKLLDEAKSEIDKLNAVFQKQAAELLKNKKVKQVEFWGNNSGKVVVTTTETLKLVSYNFLLKVIGEVLIKDFVKEEPKYKLSDPFKRLLTAIFQGDYIEQHLDEVIIQISSDDKTRKTLKKKLKGNWEKDIETLKSVANLKQNEAEHVAFFVQEAINFDKIVHLLEAAGHKPGSAELKDAIEKIRHAVVVEEGVKVGLEYEEAV